MSVVGIYLFLYKSNSHALESQAISSVVTKNGNRTKIVLPDGTQVWLNAGSNLDYNNEQFNKDLREVILNGEAYFDVTKNPGKPFIIHTRKMDIKVLGTAFNVRSYNDEKFAEAALIRGSIEVTLKDRKNQQPIILTPNEKISISTEEIQSEQKKNLIHKAEAAAIPQFLVEKLTPNPKINVISEIAWTQNKLYFEDESLENIALILERWFGKKIVITNETLGNLHYYGNFENETLEQVLSYLKLSKPFNFRIENDNVTIY
jgi:ferric-dicitrate binding protein FerR (iron transport regulator)